MVLIVSNPISWKRNGVISYTIPSFTLKNIGSIILDGDYPK